MTPPHPSLPLPCKVESYLYSLLQIAASERVVQWGFDETTINGVSWYTITLSLPLTINRTLTLTLTLTLHSLNQWVLLELPGDGNQKHNGINMTVVTMECAGVLVGATSLVVLNHIEACWARGQEAVALLRAELPGDTVETLAPLRNGGVHMQNHFGVMHDTCHAANKVLPYLGTIPLTRPHNLHPNTTLTPTLGC